MKTFFKFGLLILFFGVIQGNMNAYSQPNATVTSVTFDKTQVIRGVEMIYAAVYIRNTGNVRGTFYITVSPQDINGTWYDFTPTRASITLDPGATGGVQVTWSPSSSVPTGACYFYLKVYKSSTGSDYYTDYERSSAFTIIDQILNASFESVTFDISQIRRGIETIHCAIYIRNTGNIRGTFYITASTEDINGIWHDFLPQRISITLDPGSSGGVQVNWSPPANYPLGSCYFYSKIYKASTGTEFYSDYERTSAFSINANSNPLPINSGFIAYHVDSNNEILHSPVNRNDGNIFIYKFGSTDPPKNITSKFDIGNAMNPHFSPDGSMLTFMAIPKGESLSWSNMRVYIYDILTETLRSPLNIGQDPKFSFDGNMIVFKQDNVIKLMNLNGDIINNNVTNQTVHEESMPFFTVGDDRIIYARGVQSNSDIYIVNLNGSGNQPLANISNLHEYYPITRDANSFFYTRASGPTSFKDQIFIGNYIGNPEPVFDNMSKFECADPFPGPSPYFFFSLDDDYDETGYNLFLGNAENGDTWQLGQLGINTSLYELGVTYTSQVPSVVHVTGVSVQPPTMNLYAGGSTGTVIATVVPSNATNQNVNWTSSSIGVATVNTNGVITPIAAGTSIITATTVDGGFTATCVVNVTAPTIILTSPNGGETWPIGSTQNITWTSSGTSGNVRIEYSTNNGSTWTGIISSTPDDGNYQWTVPNTPSSNCLIRISDTDGSPTDQSNAVFTISAIPAITVTAPNGGETWPVGSTQNITWTSSGTSGNVRIEYSTNNGSTWTGIISSTPDDGNHQWSVPNTPSTNCLVRISDTDGSPTDQSNAAFAIVRSYLTITPVNQNVLSSSGTVSFDVVSNVTWTATSNQTWCTITPSGTGNGTITATYQANTGPGTRTATITVSGTGVNPQNVTVTQSGISNSPPDKPTLSTPYNVSSNSLPFRFSWTCSDPDGDELTYVLKTRMIGESNWIDNLMNTQNYLDVISIHHDYYNIPMEWCVVASDSETESTSDVWEYIIITNQLIVSPDNQNVGVEAGNTNFSITTDASWVIADHAPWLSVSPSMGQGNVDITVTYSANNSISSRIGSIIVTEGGYNPRMKTVTVTQAGTSPTLIVSPANQNASSSSGTVSFDVASNVNWTVSSNQTWCTVTPSGTGNGTITATYQTNTGPGTRTATITVSGSGVNNQTVTVTQAGTSPTLIVSPANQNASSSSGTVSFDVASNVNWTVSSNQTWCTVTPSGTGNGTITATYQTNTGPGTRTATITVSGSGVNNQTVTVTQAGTSPTLIVSPANQNASSSSGTVSFDVASNITWTVSSNQTWCTVTSSGTGNGIITATYQTNTGPGTRTATITVSGSGVNNQTVTVTQLCSSPEQPGLIAGKTRIIKNSTETYSIQPVPGASSYTWVLPMGWNGNSTSTSILVTTNEDAISGNISVVANNDCGSSEPGILYVEVGDCVTPQIFLKWDDVLICSNIDNIFLSYQWFNGTISIPGANEQYYVTSKQPGIYKVETIDINGCREMSNEITVTGSKSLTLYPNPAKSSFTVSIIDQPVGKVNLRIINSTGMKIMDIETEKADIEFLKEIPSDDLEEGFYIVQVIIDQTYLYNSKILIIK